MKALWQLLDFFIQVLLFVPAVIMEVGTFLMSLIGVIVAAAMIIPAVGLFLLIIILIF